jgi:hypothetical protein
MCCKKANQNMKLNLKSLLLAIAVSAVVSASGNSSSWSGEPYKSFWNNWGIAFNGGVTSYFGDLSIYDSDPANKLKHESKPAFGVLLTKYFRDDIGLSGQMLYGGLKGRYNEKLSFDTDFIEYNVQLRVDLLNLILRRNNTGIGLVAFGGIGHLIFNSVKTTFVEGRMKTDAHRASSPEFVYFAGGGVNYNISDRFSVNIDASVRQAQNDRIDNEVRKDNYDFYTLVNVGVTYHFHRLFGATKKGNLYRSGVRMANR